MASNRANNERRADASGRGKTAKEEKKEKKEKEEKEKEEKEEKEEYRTRNEIVFGAYQMARK